MKALPLNKVIDELKTEIGKMDDDTSSRYWFKINKIIIELGVEFEISGKGEINILVFKLGGKASQTSMNKITLDMTPLVQQDIENTTKNSSKLKNKSAIGSQNSKTKIGKKMVSRSMGRSMSRSRYRTR